MSANGFHPEFIATSASSTEKSVKYFEQFLTVPGAVKVLNTLSYHRYGTSITDIQKLRLFADKYRLKTAMLEKLNAGIDELLEDLIIGGVSAWQQWAIDGYARVNRDIAPASPEITMTPAARELSAVFRFVRRGAVRIASTSDNNDQTTAAFINPDGAWVVVIRDTAAGGPVTLNGLAPGVYRMRFVSTTNESVRWLGAVRTLPSGELKFTLPGAGVMTVYSATRN